MSCRNDCPLRFFDMNHVSESLKYDEFTASDVTGESLADISA